MQWFAWSAMQYLFWSQFQHNTAAVHGTTRYHSIQAYGVMEAQ